MLPPQSEAPFAAGMAFSTCFRNSLGPWSVFISKTKFEIWLSYLYQVALDIFSVRSCPHSTFCHDVRSLRTKHISDAAALHAGRGLPLPLEQRPDHSSRSSENIGCPRFSLRKRSAGSFGCCLDKASLLLPVTLPVPSSTYVLPSEPM